MFSFLGEIKISALPGVLLRSIIGENSSAIDSTPNHVQLSGKWFLDSDIAKFPVKLHFSIMYGFIQL